FCQRPIELGADFTVHSLTKGISGFGTDMGGAVIGPKKFQDMLLLFRKDFGAVLSSKAAWTILTYGLSTLHLRISRQTENAIKIAEYLAAHPKIEFVNYPGLPGSKYYELARKQMTDFKGNFAPGSLMFFVVKGNSLEEQKEKGRTLMNFAAKSAYTLTLAVSLGLTRTLIEHPATMTHSVIPADELLGHGIHPGGIRLAVGIENPDDIIKDLEMSLEQI
ncbi:MAG: cystathionine gamma-lyase, partial [Chlorobiota bacterium]